MSEGFTGSFYIQQNRRWYGYIVLTHLGQIFSLSCKNVVFILLMYAVLLSSDIKHLHASLEALNFANHTGKQGKGSLAGLTEHFFLAVNSRGPFQPRPFCAYCWTDQNSQQAKLKTWKLLYFKLQCIICPLHSARTRTPNCILCFFNRKRSGANRDTQFGCKTMQVKPYPKNPTEQINQKPQQRCENAPFLEIPNSIIPNRRACCCGNISILLLMSGTCQAS